MILKKVFSSFIPRKEKEWNKTLGIVSINCKEGLQGAVVVAQSVERLLPTPEIRGSNPYIGKLYLPIVHRNRKDENKENEARNGPFKKRRATIEKWHTSRISKTSILVIYLPVELRLVGWDTWISININWRGDNNHEMFAPLSQMETEGRYFKKFNSSLRNLCCCCFSTAVPRGQGVVGLNPIRCWASFFSRFSHNLSF